MAEKLLPCAMCGALPIRRVRDRQLYGPTGDFIDADSEDLERGEFHWLKCSGCSLNMTVGMPDKDDALMAWNGRQLPGGHGYIQAYKGGFKEKYPGNIHNKNMESDDAPDI